MSATAGIFPGWREIDGRGCLGRLASLRLLAAVVGVGVVINDQRAVIFGVVVLVSVVV